MKQYYYKDGKLFSVTLPDKDQPSTSTKEEGEIKIIRQNQYFTSKNEEIEIIEKLNQHQKLVVETEEEEEIEEKKEYNSISNNFYSCDICIPKLSFTTKQYYLKHMFEYHRFFFNDDSYWQPGVIKPCLCCVKPFENVLQISNTYQAQTRIHCIYCRKPFFNLAKLRKHMHIHVKAFPCLLCNASFNKLQLYHRHLWNNHSVKRCDSLPSCEYNGFFEVETRKKNKKKRRMEVLNIALLTYNYYKDNRVI